MFLTCPHLLRRVILNSYPPCEIGQFKFSHGEHIPGASTQRLGYLLDSRIYSRYLITIESSMRALRVQSAYDVGTRWKFQGAGE